MAKARILTNEEAALAPVHPGEILREEFLQPLGLNAPQAAARLGVPRTRIERLAREETPVTPDTALRLGRLFGTTAEFWMNLQTRFDLISKRAELGPVLHEIQVIEAA
jgi:addiction module HigA family antidote